MKESHCRHLATLFLILTANCMLTMASAIDSDLDGMDDVWENQYKHAGTLAPDEDPDLDGLSNLEESLAGTDPLNSNSRLQANAARLSNGTLTLDIESQPGKRYQVVSSQDLRQWIPSGEAILATDSALNFEHTLQSNHDEFLRIESGDTDTDGDGISDWAELQLPGFDPYNDDSFQSGFANNDYLALQNFLHSKQRSYTTSEVSGDGGIVTLERALYYVDQWETSIDVWIGRLAGNAGPVTIDFELLPGSIGSGAAGYEALSGQVSFANKEVGFKKVRIQINERPTPGSQYFIFQITGIDNENARVTEFDRAYVKIDDGSLDPDALFVNSVEGDDNASGVGVANKRRTLNNAVKDFRAGQGSRIYLEAADTPYREQTNEDLGGVEIHHPNGSDTSFLRIEGIGEKRPVIDNDFYGSGIHIKSGSCIWISGLEITQTSIGIYARGESIEKVIVDNCHIHDCRGTDNIGAIRFDGIRYGLIHNNYLHHTYDDRASSWKGDLFEDPIITQAGPYYGYHSAIHGYNHRSCIAEYNTIHDSGKNIFQKAPNYHDQDALIVRNNYLANADSESISHQIAGAGNPALVRALAYFNIAVNTKTFVEIHQGETTTQCDDVRIFSNTLYQSANSGTFNAATNIEFFDNLQVGQNDEQWNNPTTLTFRKDEGELADITIRYIDHNTYFARDLNHIFERYGPDGANFTTLSELQTAYTDWPSKFGNLLSENIELASDQVDPMLKNPSSGDFRLAPSSPARQTGRFGQSRGAYFDDSIQIGRLPAYWPDAMENGPASPNADPDNPAGEVSFTTDFYRISETGVEVAVEVTRQGGSAGRVSAELDVRRGFNYRGPNISDTLTIWWEDGELGTKLFTIPIPEHTPQGIAEIKPTLYRVTGGLQIASPETRQTTIRIDNGTVNPDAFYVDKDHPDASDSNPGTASLPFLTIQKLIETLEQEVVKSDRLSKIGYVRQSTTPYSALDARHDSYPYAGNSFSSKFVYRFNNVFNGFKDYEAIEQIIVSGYPGERPIIDNAQQLGPDDRPASAFYIHHGRHLTIRNFEIRSTNGSGIQFNPDADTEYGEAANSWVQLEDLHIHSVTGEGSIGIDLGDSPNTIVRNCIVED